MMMMMVMMVLRFNNISENLNKPTIKLNHTTTSNRNSLEIAIVFLQFDYIWHTGYSHFRVKINQPKAGLQVEVSIFLLSSSYWSP